MTTGNPEAFAPGEYIAEELEARSWSQLDLADILGRPPQAVNEIINGKRAITAETAKGLGDAFGTSAQLWMNLQSAYELARMRHSDSNTVSRKAELYKFAPVGEMQKRGWIEKSSNFEVVESQVLGFFGVGKVGDRIELAAAARKSTDGELTQPQKAWLIRAIRIAKTVQVTGRFSRSSLKVALDALSALKADPEEARKVPRVLSEAGIRFLIVAPLPNSKIDGVCFWLSDSEPVVVLSFRFDRIDWFWHTLMHELGHVWNGDGKKAPTLDVQLLGSDSVEPTGDIENRANAFAVSFLVDQAEMHEFIARTPVYSRLKIVGFAKRLGVHPGIVVGQLQRRKLVPYQNFRPLICSIRNVVMANAVTDGWSSSATV